NYGTLRITDFSRSRFPVTTTDCGFPTVTTTFNNFGRIDIQGGTLQLAGSGFVAGSVNASADSILLFAGSTSGTYTLKDGLVFSGPGAFQLGNGGSAVVEGTIKGTMIELLGGRLAGVGRIVGDVHNTAGQFVPGSPFGTLAIGGNYVQGPAGSVEFVLGGSTSCTSRSQLEVDQSAYVVGSLTVGLRDGCSPTRGQQFPLLAAGSLVGTPTNVTLPPSLRFDHDATTAFVTAF